MGYKYADKVGFEPVHAWEIQGEYVYLAHTPDEVETAIGICSSSSHPMAQAMAKEFREIRNYMINKATILNRYN